MLRKYSNYMLGINYLKFLIPEEKSFIFTNISKFKRTLITVSVFRFPFKFESYGTQRRYPIYFIIS